MKNYFIAIACVIGIATGQLLFKLGANSIKNNHDAPNFLTFLLLGSAMLLYAITSIAWVSLLRSVELGRIYPLMALAFILVPIGSHFFLGENFSQNYILGVALIVCGLIITTNS